MLFLTTIQHRSPGSLSGHASLLYPQDVLIKRRRTRGDLPEILAHDLRQCS